MVELTFDRKDVNLAALDAALRAGLGDAVAGVSAAHGQVRVHLLWPPGADEICRARQIVAAHDARQLTGAQAEARALRERRAGLDAEVHALDLSAPLALPALEKAVRWLVLRALERG